MDTIAIDERIARLRAGSAAHKVGIEMLRSNITKFRNDLERLQQAVKTCEDKFTEVSTGISEGAIIYNMTPSAASRRTGS